MSTVAIILGHSFTLVKYDLQEQIDLCGWRTNSEQSFWQGRNGDRIYFANRLERLRGQPRDIPVFEHDNLTTMRGVDRYELRDVATKLFGAVKRFEELKLNELTEKSDG